MNTETLIAIIVSVIALLSTIIGPMITAWRTCKHEKEMYKLRFYKEHEHEVIERYLRVVGRFAFGQHYDDQKNLGEALSEIFMYAPEELWDDIQSINSEIISILNIKLNSDRNVHMPELQQSYIKLCRSFAPYRRSDKNTSAIEPAKTTNKYPMTR